MANIKIIRITCTDINTAYNAATGTTEAPTTARDSDFVGQEATFQNQTAGSTVSIGGSDITVVGGLQIPYQGAFSLGGLGGSSTSIQLQDLWVTSSTAGGIVVILLRKAV